MFTGWQKKQSTYWYFCEFSNQQSERVTKKTTFFFIMNEWMNEVWHDSAVQSGVTGERAPGSASLKMLSGCVLGSESRLNISLILLLNKLLHFNKCHYSKSTQALCFISISGF